MPETRLLTLTAIYGSPRHGGNSDALLDAAVNGAEQAGAVVHRLYLRDLRVEPCENCGQCATTGECRQIKDEMSIVYDALDHSDIILLGSPIYFCSLCAQVKAMIDRCQPYWARKYVLKQTPPRKDRLGGFICCGGFKDDRFLACTEQIIKTWYSILRIHYHGVFFIPGLDARNDAARHPTATKDALAYGRDLVLAASATVER